MRKDFEDCIVLIESEKIRNFVKKALDSAPTEFWTAPCSSTGKHHPPEDNDNGGIIVHSRKAVQLADYWASQEWCPFVCDELVK